MIEDGRTLVVVADGRRARVFEEARLDGPLHERSEWLSDLKAYSGGDSGSPGRVYDRMGHASHGMKDEAPHDKGENEFLVGLVGQIETVMREQRFDSLVIIAAPRALGVLRAELSKETQRKLTQSDPHERVDETADQIHKAVHALRRASA